MTKLLLGGVLGGIVLFAWLGFSWAVLPFHRAAFHELPKKTYSSTTGSDVTGPVAAVVTMQESGLPSPGVFYSGKPHEGTRGPQIPFMVWLPRGYPSMTSVMLRGLLFSILAALTVTLIVLAGRQRSYRARVGLCLCIGAVVALAGPATMGNFFFFPAAWVLPDVFDQLIGWTLAGLVIAAFTKPMLTTTSTST